MMLVFEGVFSGYFSVPPQFYDTVNTPGGQQAATGAKIPPEWRYIRLGGPETKYLPRPETLAFRSYW
jgi:hypothetical protein